MFISFYCDFKSSETGDESNSFLEPLVLALYRWDLTVADASSGSSLLGCAGTGILNSLDTICTKLIRKPDNIIKKAIISLRLTVCLR